MKLIPLTQNQFAIVDDEDHDWLAQYKWHVHRSSDLLYAARTNPDKDPQITFMHRQVMNAPDGVKVDHRNRNGLDCRKENLRHATHSQNLCNQIGHRNTGSRFKGVYFHKPSGKWRAVIRTPKGRLYFLAATEIEAAVKYDEACLKHHGEFARLNRDRFPELFQFPLQEAI